MNSLFQQRIILLKNLSIALDYEHEQENEDEQNL
jgi:hypothetical protein